MTTPQQIDSFLKQKGSPMAGMGAVFVGAGKKYGVDPALAVAISGIESSFGKHTFKPYNAWGWMSGSGWGSWEQGISTVIAYNKKALDGVEVKSVSDLLDNPKLKGRVGFLTEMRDSIGMTMLDMGKDPAKFTDDDYDAVIARLQKAVDKGQIRRFTGNDYADDLASGNIAVAQAYSGDVVQLQADNPDLQFVIPETGGDWFIDTMVIPYTTQNQKAAEAWINYVYDRPNYAKLVAFTQYVPVLSDMTGELNKIDPKLGSNPLINPPQASIDKLKSWADLTDEQTQEFNTLYAAVTGG